jgi:hypothetical protein
VPVAGSIVLSTVRSAPLASFVAQAVERVDGQLLAGTDLRHERGQLVLGQREDDVDGLELRDDGEPGRVGRVDEVARIDAAEADPAGDGRRHAAVDEVQLRGVDLALVDDERGLVLADEGHLRVELLLRDRVFLRESAVARHVDLRVREERLIARELSSACSSCTWNGRGSISARRSPLPTVWPSSKWTAMSCPSTRVWTVTTARG